MILMRHGETAANEAHIFCGRLDPPLSPQGEAQTRRTAQMLSGPFDRVLASPALRARQTAQIVCPNMQPEILPALREIDFGEFEGFTADELQSRMPEAWARYMSDPLNFVFPDGDDAAHYLRDAEQTAWALTQEQGRVLVVSHKGFLTAVLSALLHGDTSHMFHYDIAPAGAVAISVSGGFAVLRQF